MSLRPSHYSTGKISIYTKEPVRDPDPREWLARIHDVTNPPLSVVKADGMKRTLKIELRPWGDLCLQEFRWDLKRRIFSPFKKSRGERIWALSRHLLDCGVLIPEPVLFLEIRSTLFLRRTYLATPWLGQKIDLGQIALKQKSNPEWNFEYLLGEAVDMVARLHDGGFLHGDLKWSNFSYVLGEPPTLMLMDLDSLKKSSSAFRQGRDLSRFILSTMEYDSCQTLAGGLMERYLEKRGCSKWLLTASLRWHISRKRKRYLSRRKTRSGQP